MSNDRFAQLIAESLPEDHWYLEGNDPSHTAIKALLKACDEGQYCDQQIAIGVMLDALTNKGWREPLYPHDNYAFGEEARKARTFEWAIGDRKEGKRNPSRYEAVKAAFLAYFAEDDTCQDCGFIFYNCVCGHVDL